MNLDSINLKEKFSKFHDHWEPKVIAEMNDYQFKLVKFKGEFVWHQHSETDETFLIVAGNMTIEFRNGKVELSEGEMFIVPRGVEHKPAADNECWVLLIEPKGTTNTGDVSSELTAESDVWI